MNKKTILISGIIVVLIAIGIFLYFRESGPVPEEEEIAPSQTEEEEDSTEPSASEPATTGEEEEEEEEEEEVSPVGGPGLSSCVVLDEEYCGKGIATYWPSADSYPSEIPSEIREKLAKNEGNLAGLAFKLSKEKIYAPFDGLVSSAIGIESGIKDITINKYPLEFQNSLEFSFSNAKIDSGLEQEFRAGSERVVKDKNIEDILGAVIKVKKGELIGTIEKAEVDLGTAYKVPILEGYNFLIGVQRVDRSTTGAVPSAAPEIIRQYFSHIE